MQGSNVKNFSASKQQQEEQELIDVISKDLNIELILIKNARNMDAVNTKTGTKWELKSDTYFTKTDGIAFELFASYMPGYDRPREPGWAYRYATPAGPDMIAFHNKEKIAVYDSKALMRYFFNNMDKLGTGEWKIKVGVAHNPETMLVIVPRKEIEQFLKKEMENK